MSRTEMLSVRSRKSSYCPWSRDAHDDRTESYYLRLLREYANHYSKAEAIHIRASGSLSQFLLTASPT